MTTVYMIVSRDKYRLPRWWGTSKQIEDMKRGMAQLAKAVAVKEEMEWWND